MADPDTCPLTLRVIGVKHSWIRYFVLGWLINGTSSRAGDGISRCPSVVAVNLGGKERRLMKLSSDEEAKAAMGRIEADMDILGLPQWCEKYDVPAGGANPWEVATSCSTGLHRTLAERFRTQTRPVLRLRPPPATPP